MRALASTRSHGDFHLGRVPAAELERRRRALLALPWTMLDEVHGTTVVDVRHPGDGDRRRGDVLVTGRAGAALGVWAGDCAVVVVAGADGRFGVAHAGWRGLAAGVVDTVCSAVGVGADTVCSAVGVGVGTTRAAVPAGPAAFLGPCIGPCCYEFGDADLATVAAAVDVAPAAITGTTTWGTASLDVPAAVAAALSRHGVALDRSATCTACDGDHYSHRARRESGRHVVVAWRSAA